MRWCIVKGVALGLSSELCATTTVTAGATTTGLIVTGHALHAKYQRRAVCSRCVWVWLPMGLVLDHHLLNGKLS